MYQQPVYNFEADQRPGVMPVSGLYGRISALGRKARNSQSMAMLLGAGSGAVLLSAISMLAFIIWTAVMTSSSTYSPGSGFGGEELFMMLAMYVMPIFGAVAGAFAYKAMYQKRFSKAQQETRQLLNALSVPLLIADETYCHDLLIAIRERGGFLLTPPPPHAIRLEDQLTYAASYIRALARPDFAKMEPQSPAVRHGTRGYLCTTPAAKVLIYGASAGCLLSGVSCIFAPLIPAQVIRLLRQAEQQGSLAAICDFFSDEPLPAARAFTTRTG